MDQIIHKNIVKALNLLYPNKFVSVEVVCQKFRSIFVGERPIEFEYRVYVEDNISLYFKTKDDVVEYVKSLCLNKNEYKNIPNSSDELLERGGI